MSQDLSKNTLAKGLRLLEIVAEVSSANGATLNNIVEASHDNKSNVYRYLMTLCELGWLERDEDTFRYLIGSKYLQVASLATRQFDLRLRSGKILQKLAKDLNLTVHLAVLQPPFIVYLEKIESVRHPMMQSRPGISAYCHSTAVGKAIMASMSDQEIRTLLPEVLENRTPNTITQIEDLLQHLKEVRLKGYSVDNEENELGISCVGAPVFGFDHRVIGAISATGNTQEFTTERIEGLGKAVINAANQVSMQMGCLINIPTK